MYKFASVIGFICIGAAAVAMLGLGIYSKM